MAGIRETRRKLEKLRDNFTTVVVEAFEETAPEFIALNKEQLLKGLNRNDESLGSYKNKYYERKKIVLNPEADGRKDYRVKGDYYRGIIMTVEDGKLKIRSTDEKAKWLEQVPDQRFGLDSENRIRFINEFLKPAIANSISKTLNG